MLCPTSPITILIADDHPLILAGLAALIHSMPQLQLVAQADNGARAVELYRQHRPQVVIMDLSMPVMHGLDAIANILAFDAAARIVILTTYQGDEDVHRGLRAGARGYLLKTAAPSNSWRASRRWPRGRNSCRRKWPASWPGVPR